MWHIHPDLSWQSQDRAPPAHRPPKKVLGAELSTDPPATPQGPVMKLEEVAKCGKLWPNDQSTDSFHSGISFQCFKLGSPQAILGRTHGRHHRPQGCSRELWMQKLQRLSNILEELRVIRSRHPEPSARLGVVVPQATLIWKRGSTCNWMSDWKIPFVRPDQILCHLCLKIRVVGKLLKKLSSAPLTQRKNTSTINTSLGISLHRNRERLVGNPHHKPNSCDSAIICGNSWSHLQHGFRILHNINIASTWHNMIQHDTCAESSWVQIHSSSTSKSSRTSSSSAADTRLCETKSWQCLQRSHHRQWRHRGTGVRHLHPRTGAPSENVSAAGVKMFQPRKLII